MRDRRRQEDRSADTRRALLDAGRALFGELGYAATGREAIVARAGVTRGALQHHFGGKRDLFEAVHLAAEAEIADRVAAAALEKENSFERLQAGCCAFVDAVGDTDLQRITLLDAPAVLGWQRCREIDAEYGLGLLTAGIDAAIAAGEIESQSVAPLATFVLGGLIETAMQVARAHDRAKARAEAITAITNLLLGIARPR